MASTSTVDGSATGYRPTRTLTFRTELRRQASRRRTQFALGFMAVLPLIVLIAFEFGRNGNDRPARSQFAALADIATAGGLNFALFTLLVSSSFLLIVVVALFCGDTVASEASWGSLRYLLAVPVPRSRLLGSKLLVSLFSCAVALVVLTGVALGAGTLRYGWHPLRTTVAGDIPAGTALLRLLMIVGYLAVSLLVVASLAFLLSVSTDAPLGAGTMRYGWHPLQSTIAGEIATGSALLRLLGIVGYLAVSLLVVAGLAFLLSVSTDAPLGAVGGAVLLQILSSILDQITALGNLRLILPTHYGTAWLGLLSSPVQTDDVVKGCVSALVYATLFFALGWYRFLRKDVVS